ncbi:MAG TPA: hypothetical protein VLC09_02810, partial [Polyangiaceae bacterium]|nr:hypothetical protein [Polyangiaceae bacterium]
MRFVLGGGIAMTMILSSGLALAQEPAAVGASSDATTDGTAAETAPAEGTEEAAPAATESEEKSSGSPSGDADGARFRFGVAGGGGFLSGSDSFGGSATYGYGGMDLRFGAQINDLIGVYAQPQLGFYGANGGVGGLAGVTALVDFTFLDQFFVGVGAGY